MNMAINELRFNAIMIKYPGLCANGFTGGEPFRYSDFADEGGERAQYERATEFLQLFTMKAASFNKHNSSYSLKHMAERYWDFRYGGDSYMSNGVFILAALMLGYNARATARSGPNVFFKIKVWDKFATVPLE